VCGTGVRWLLVLLLAGCTTQSDSDGAVETDGLICLGYCAHVLHGISIEVEESTGAEELKEVVKEHAKKEVLED